MPRLPCQLLLLSCLAAPLALAAAQDDAQQLAQTVAAEFKDGRYADAERDCGRLAELQPKDPGHPYNLACAQARQGHSEQALASLAKAVELGFGDAAHAQEDDDLASLRQLPAFAKLVETMKGKPVNDGSPYEAGAEIPGLKTVERAPGGGLRYRLRMSEQATAEKPHRLVVWLHPSGGSMDQVVEPLAKALAEHGYALMVFTQKQYRGWTGPEMQAIAASINDLANVPGVDGRKPVLMGFSAGGQAALILWHGNPDAFGGLMTTAAYPIDQAKGNSLLAPPAGDAAAKTPILALVGSADQGGAGEKIWHQVEPSWAKAGVPLTLRVVKGRVHEFLFFGEEWTNALAWLDALRDGKAKAAAKKPDEQTPP
jgi:predicted esterase